MLSFALRCSICAICSSSVSSLRASEIKLEVPRLTTDGAATGIWFPILSSSTSAFSFKSPKLATTGAAATTTASFSIFTAVEASTGGTGSACDSSPSLSRRSISSLKHWCASKSSSWSEKSGKSSSGCAGCSCLTGTWVTLTWYGSSETIMQSPSSSTVGTERELPVRLPVLAIQLVSDRIDTDLRLIVPFLSIC